MAATRNQSGEMLFLAPIVLNKKSKNVYCLPFGGTTSETPATAEEKGIGHTKIVHLSYSTFGSACVVLHPNTYAGRYLRLLYTR